MVVGQLPVFDNELTLSYHRLVALWMKPSRATLHFMDSFHEAPLFLASTQAFAARPLLYKYAAQLDNRSYSGRRVFLLAAIMERRLSGGGQKETAARNQPTSIEIYKPLDRNCRRTLLTQLTDQF